VKPGFYTEGLHGGATITTKIGCNPANGDLLTFTHSIAGSASWRLKVIGEDILFDYGNLDVAQIYVITGLNTVLTFGPLRGPLPHAFYTPKLVIGGTNEKGIDNPMDARRVMCFPQLKPDNPPAALATGDWEKGDFCFNSSPEVNGVLGWSCTGASEPAVAATPGKPGTLYKQAIWTPVRLIEEVAAQAPSSATDLTTLKCEFNSLLEKMRAAGILAKT
jgi:hypothetical protein